MQGIKILAAVCALVSLVAADGGRISPAKRSTNPCSGQEDGIFLPVTGSCSKYIICLGGVPNELDCGGNHFNVKLSTCDLPERAGCVGSPPLPVPTSAPPKPITTSPCYAVANGISLPVPGNPRQYYYCMNNKAYVKDCGYLFFVAKYSACAMLPDNEPHTIITRPVAPPTNNHEVEVTACYGRPNGVSIPVPGNQRQYYFCMNNKAFLKDCGHLFFVSRYSACAMLPENEPQTIINRPVVPPTTKYEVGVTTCYGKPNGVSISVAGNQRQYYFCMNNKAFLKDCGHLFFVARYQACAPSPDSKEIAHPIEELKMTDKYEEIARRVCRNQVFGARIAYPGSCSWYFICTFNTGFLKTCSWREFNSKTASCDLPENVRCKAHENEIPNKTSDDFVVPTKPTPTDTLAARICKTEEDGTFKAAPGQCSDFYFCLQKMGYRKTCGATRHFNPKTLTCIDSRESNCVDILPKAARAISPRAVSCANQELGTLLSSDSDCGRFLICDNPGPVEMDCPEGLHFNAEDKVCDWPTNAKCSL